MNKTMKSRYRLWQRRGEVFYAFDRETKKQISLGTKDKNEAIRLLNARNEAHANPLLNRQIARAYLAASDPSIARRTWRQAFEALTKTKDGANRARWERAIKDKAFKTILDLSVIETRPEHFLAVLNAGTVSTNVFLRRIHNFALDMEWLLKSVIPKRQWPKVRYKEKRGITETEHQQIMAAERNPERRAYYELCWQLGASQGDVAQLSVEDNIDWQERTVSYARRKNQQPAIIRIDEKLEALLRALPSEGPLFPYLRTVESKDRANEFRQRCERLGIKGVTLHSYRYAWAERAKAAGYPERFAQENLGHGSKAVHRAYAKKAKVVIPSLAEWQKNQGKDIIPLFPPKSQTPANENSPAGVNQVAAS